MLSWMDGFEHYGDSETHMQEGVGGGAAWASVENTWALSTANPATGSYHIRLSDTSSPPSRLRRVLGQSSQVVGHGYRFSISDLPDTEGSYTQERLVMSHWSDVSNGGQVAIGMGTDGSVFSYCDATTLGRSDPVFSPGGYHHFERKTKIDNSTGYDEVRINEVTVLNLTGVDTQLTGNASAAQIRVALYGSVSSGSVGFGTFDVDDFFAWDDDSSDAENTVVDFVGDKGCYYLPTNADTAEADWTLSTGATGYSLLDEVDPDDADYITDSTGTARSVFGVAALPGNVAEVIAMMPVIRARKEESGSVTLRGGVVVSSSESYTPDNSPSTEFAYMTPGPKTIDPDTGVAWTNTADPSLLIERTV